MVRIQYPLERVWLEGYRPISRIEIRISAVAKRLMTKCQVYGMQARTPYSEIHSPLEPLPLTRRLQRERVKVQYTNMIEPVRRRCDEGVEETEVGARAQYED